MSDWATVLITVLPVLISSIASIFVAWMNSRDKIKLAKENSILQIKLSEIQAKNKLDLSDRDADNKIKIKKEEINIMSNKIKEALKEQQPNREIYSKILEDLN